MSVFPSLGLASLLLFALSPIASGDGGVLLGRWETPDALLFLFTKNAPMAAGPIELEVMAQDPATGDPMLNGRVEFEIKRSGIAPLAGEEWLPPCCRTKLPEGDQWEITAQRATTGNRLFYTAHTIFQKPGEYEVALTYIGPKHLAQAGLTVAITPPAPPWLTYWPMLSLPFAALGLFVANRRLARSASSSK